MPRRRERNLTRGATLLELVVALAVLAVLAAMAHSSHREHVLRAQRTEAKAALLRLQADQERFYTLNGNRYTADLTRLGYAAATAVPTENGRYLLSVDAGADARAFVARATTAGAMARDEECRQFTIDAQNRKRAHPDPRGRCW